ncbi:MAG: FdhF/YdeP family oxidoreductase [Panacagrimonas sp.]
MTKQADVEIEPYDGPAGGWGSVQSLARYLWQEDAPIKTGAALRIQNKPDGFTCVSCAWAKPATPHPFEFCEEGAKATAWELTDKRAGPDFFAAHRLSELENWSDHDLEAQGRLTHPLRWNPVSDCYEPVGWPEAFAGIGHELRALDPKVSPKSSVFYASGRASLETAYLWQLFARMYGHNNLPDSSNMCHETTSVALPESIGVPVGTVRLDDFEKTDAIFLFGQNVGTSSPRMLHPLQAASKRGVPIVVFNPLRERGLEFFTNPQAPVEMLTGAETRIASQYLQVKANGDMAALMGMCKALIAADDAALTAGEARRLDTDFIAQHTQGFDAFADLARAAEWPVIESASGLSRAALVEASATYAKAEAAMILYGMGLTQHREGVETVQMLMNLLLLRGNIGKPGAGVCPVRGHSNVQGQRTVGITEKPELAPLDRLSELYGFEPPREKGMATVASCKAIMQGEVRAFVALGGNFLRAVPETGAMEIAWRKQRLTVGIATKLNRSHVLHGEIAYLLPCLGRIETDVQAGGEQVVSTEDSTACIHGSRGRAAPASKHLLSELKIVAELAKATLDPNPKVDWDAWSGDYGSVRDAIERTWPEQFRDFNARLFTPGGFPRPLPARDRIWNTDSGKAQFIVPTHWPPQVDADPAVLRLMTLRSNDQFNTTIYGFHDRFRGVSGTRLVVFMNRIDMDRLQLAEAQSVSLITAVADGVHREVHDLRVTPYDIPVGCVGGYFPECNPLMPVDHHAEGSMVPAAKSIPVRVRASGA